MPSPPPKDDTKRWQCDVCKVAFFLDFDEAVRHEEQCQGIGDADRHHHHHHHSRGLKFDDDTYEDDIDDVDEKEHDEDQQDQQDPPATSKSRSSPSLSSASKDVHPFFSRQQSKAVSSKQKTSKSKTTSKQPAGSFFLPRFQQIDVKHNQKATDDATRNKKAAVTKKRAKTLGQQKTKTKTTTTTTKKSSASTLSTSSSSQTKTTNKGGCNQSSSKITPPEIATDDPELASIFQNKSMKQIIAEQRLAEFQAKRNTERQRERDRQATRALLFQNGDDKGSRSSIDTLGMKRKASSVDATGISSQSSSILNRNHKMTLLPLPPLFPVPNHVLGGDNNGTKRSMVLDKSEIRLGNVWRPKSSESPSCILADEKDTRREIKLVSSISELDVTTSTTTMIQQALSETLVPPRSTPPRTKTNTHDGEISTKTWNDKYGMDHGLVGSDTQQVYQQLVEVINYWKSARHDVLQRMAERQRRFQVTNGASFNTKAKSAKKKRKKKGSNYGYGSNDFIVDEDEDYELDDDDELSKLCMLIGPSSSGKTSLVHHVAGRQNCTVVEINTSSVRSGAALKRSIQDATQSTSSLGTFQTKKRSTVNFFAPRSKENVEISVDPATSRKNDDSDFLLDSEDEDDDSVEQNRKQDELQKMSLTIILVDEVDILFEDDQGFWAALASVVKTTKCPIILTANQYPPNIFSSSQFPCQFIETKRPSPLECAKKILQICQHEEIEIQPHVRSRGPESTHQQLAWIADVCDCDLRRMMFELQLFAAPSSFSSASLPPVETNKSTTENNKSEHALTQSEWRPKIFSLEPSTVPMDIYSIISLRGKNFLTIPTTSNDAVVWIGCQKCQYKIVDDEKMLVLCPPLSTKESQEDEKNSTYSSRLVRRVVPVSLECRSIGIFKRACPYQVVVRSQLVDGNEISSTRRLSLLYEYPENSVPQRQTESEDEINEFDCSDEDRSSHRPKITTIARNIVSCEEGESLWQATLSNLESEDFSKSPSDDRIPRPDRTMLDILEKQSRNAANNSDAAVLEDELHGLPYLAGACKGFAFDYTEECIGKSQSDMLRMRDNSRPPQEEKLIELGWKDDFGFYGDPDWLMTYPPSSICRRQMNDMMNRLRGNVAVSGTLAMDASNQPSLDATGISSREDLDRYALQSSTICGEDQFLPFPVQPVFELLPKLLRANMSCDSSKDIVVGPVFDKEQARCVNRDQSWASYILPRTADRARWSYGRFGSIRVTDLGEYELYGDGREVLELMPMFRRIALLEQATDYAATIAEQQQEASCRRSNRRATRGNGGPLNKTRHCFFDRLSLKLRRDEAALSSTELGSQLADAFIKY